MDPLRFIGKNEALGGKVAAKFNGGLQIPK